MDLLKKYFPQITELQLEKLILFEKLIKEWNNKINLISRKDVENFDRNINSLKKVLGKEEEEENIESMPLNQSDLMDRMQQLRKNMSPNDMMNLMNRFLGK